MTRRERILLWGLLAVGVLVRLIVDFTTDGVQFDIESFGLVAQAFDEHELDFYGAVNGGQPVPRWPYPPGFLPWIELTQRLDQHLGVPFNDAIQLPSILADAAIAWLVQHHLGWRGAAARTRLVAAGAVALGPVFIMVSGFHGQIDAVAILPAVAAVVLWEEDRVRGSRALWAGLLIGLGAATKSIPLLMLLALLPSVRSRREAATLVTGAVAVPFLLLAPFLLTDLTAVREALSYNGRPGLGGLSLIAQPSLVRDWLTGQLFEFNVLSRWLIDYGNLVTLAGVSLTALAAYRRRLPPVETAALLWLAVYAFGANWFPWYPVWGLPFFIMAALRPAIALQLLLVVPAAFAYFASSWVDRPDVLWVLVMLVFWCVCVGTIALVAAGVRAEDLRPAQRLAALRSGAGRWWRATAWPVRALWLFGLAQLAFVTWRAFFAYDEHAWDLWWVYVALERFTAGLDPYDVYMFVNPPATLLLLAPFGAVGFAASHAAFIAVSAACFAVAGMLALKAAGLRWWGLPGAVLLVLLSYPTAVRSTLGLGNVNAIVVLGEAAALAAMLARRWTLGGVALGLSFAIKPILVPLLFVPVLARQWRSVAVAVAVPTVLSLAAIAVVPEAIGFVTDKVSFLLGGNAEVLRVGNVSVRGAANNLGLPGAVGEVARLATLAVALWLAWGRWNSGPGEDRESDVARRLRVLETSGLVMLATLLCFSFSWSYYGVYLLPLAVTVAHREAALRHPVGILGLVSLALPFVNPMPDLEATRFEMVGPTLSWLVILAGMGLGLRTRTRRARSESRAAAPAVSSR